MLRKYRLTILVGACALFVALALPSALWLQERKQVRQTIQAEADFVKNKIAADMESRVLALVRMGKRWEIRGQPSEGEWESDAALVVSRHQGFRAVEWVDADLRVRRVAPSEGRQAELGRDLGSDPLRREALETARDTGEVTLKRSGDPRRGDAQLLICVPVFPQRTFSGFIVGVFRVEEWLNATLQNIAPGYTLAVFDGDTQIYARPSAGAPRHPDWSATTEIRSHALAWRAQVWPRPDLLERARSPLPKFAFWDGLLMAALLTLAMLLNQMERERARQLGTAYLELRNEIAERRQAEQALLRSEGNYRSLVENAPDGIYRLSPEGDRFLAVNRALVEMLGYASEAELLGANPATDIFSDPSELAALLERYRRQRFESTEAQWKRKDGAAITVRLSGRPVLDDRGAPESFEFIAEDVTERRALEARLQQAQKMEAIGRLAGGVAHDFNNLLMVIRGYAHMLTEILPRADPLRRNPEEILHAADRAAALTRQLLAFSGKQVLQPQVLDLNALVADAGKLLPPLLGEHIELFFSLDPALGAVKADRTQLEQALVNLVVNARDAMPQGGELTVETCNVELDDDAARRLNGLRPGSYVRLEVRDTGHGMDAETRALIFEPFFSTKPGRGTGLGLSSVYGLVEQSGGAIQVESEPGRGTSFQIFLPRAEGGVTPAAALPGAPAGSLQGTETVLVVEDEEGVRRLTREFLLLRGYTVLEARNGAEALELAARHLGPIHLLVTDVVMPGMNGREVAERLTAARPETKVLYMSAYTEDAIVTYGILAPGTAFLEKPFTPDDLARQARRLLDAARPAHAG